jgi:hypothetical protein
MKGNENVADGSASSNTGTSSTITAAPPAGTSVLQPGRQHPRSVPLSSIKPTKVDWLLEPRIPRGSLTIVAGDPGVGKSLFTVDLAARATRGELTGEPLSVLFVVPEDDEATSLAPRLLAAGADSERVFSFRRSADEEESVLQLPKDMEALEREIRATGAALVVIDPLMACLERSVDSFKDQSSRGALSPLKSIAGRTGAAIVAVMHLNKKEATSMVRRLGGSVAFFAAARSVFLLGATSAEGQERVLIHAKSNVGPLAPALGYELEQITVAGGIETGRLHDLGEVSITEEQILSDQAPRRPRKIDQATQFVRSTLEAGRMTARELEQLATEQNIASKTLERARQQVGVIAEKGEGGISILSLPDTATVAESA